MCIVQPPQKKDLRDSPQCLLQPAVVCGSAELQQGGYKKVAFPFFCNFFDASSVTAFFSSSRLLLGKKAEVAA